MNYLETTEEVDLTVRGLMAGSQSVTSFVLSLLQAANVQRDLKSIGRARVVSIQIIHTKRCFVNNKKRGRTASEFKKEEIEK